MPERLEIAYSLIALMVAIAIYGAYRLSQHRKEQRRLGRGGRPRQ